MIRNWGPANGSRKGLQIPVSSDLQRGFYFVGLVPTYSIPRSNKPNLEAVLVLVLWVKALVNSVFAVRLLISIRHGR